jgi:hypothetical protein
MSWIPYKGVKRVNKGVIAKFQWMSDDDTRCKIFRLLNIVDNAKLS